MFVTDFGKLPVLSSSAVIHLPPSGALATDHQIRMWLLMWITQIVYLKFTKQTSMFQMSHMHGSVFQKDLW